jgi:quinolinate synthase
LELIEKIERLKKERKAVILAHNYQIPEVQDCADFVGDSLGLSIEAAKTDAEVIVFCGCPMADMITGDQLRALKAEHPGAKVICYVNTSAEVKAECDLCCTSANAVKMVAEGLKDAKEIIFVPDQYLAAFVAGKTGRTFITWPGFCPTHARILPEHVTAARTLHPGCAVIVHPECRAEVSAMADITISTGGMSQFAHETQAKEIIVGTEPGIIYRLKKENPDKVFYPIADRVICPNMKKTTLEKVFWSLEGMKPAIEVPEPIASRARRSIEAMLAIG